MAEDLPIDGLCTHAAFIEGVNFGNAEPEPTEIARLKFFPRHLMMTGIAAGFESN